MKPTLCKVLPLFCFAGVLARCPAQEYPAVPGGAFDPSKMEMYPTMCPTAVSVINYSGGNMNSDEGHNFDSRITFNFITYLNKTR